MILRFEIAYRTQWGQQLCVCGDLPELGSWQPDDAPALSYQPGGLWTLEIDVQKVGQFSYKYFLRENGGQQWEHGSNREHQLPKSYDRIVLRDAWRPKSVDENALLSSAFTRVLMRRDKDKKVKHAKRPTHRFEMEMPRVGSDQVLCVIGSDPALGSWEEADAVIMDGTDFPHWRVDVELEQPDRIVDYKYGVYDPKEKRILTWDQRDNRSLIPPPSETNEDENDVMQTGVPPADYQPLTLKKPAPKSEDAPSILTVVGDRGFRFPLGNWKGAGVAVPVFSLRSATSSGVGTFTDLKLLIDWARATGMKLVQVLPVNDTVATHTWTDSYPYAAISVFALHPLYADLRDMGTLRDKKLAKEIFAEADRLNTLSEIDYEGVMRLKSRYFKALYDQEKKKFLASKAFEQFLEKNAAWLKPYAAFSALRDRYETADFSAWGEFARYDAGKIEKLLSPKAKDHDDFAIHYFIQYHLDRQLREAADYGRKQGVVLKGDIPIGIYRYSVDAWVAPELYNMDTQAGAPPDDFAVNGQNWGFPTYNWAEMAKDDYAWWRMRLTQMSAYFDAFRIDHILGFFRIWEIPLSQVRGLMGRFNPALPLSRQELIDRLGWFDFERLCVPYIREYMLWDRFGSYTDEVKWNYLVETGPGRYSLKSECDTQRKILRIFNPEDRPEAELDERNARIMGGLMSLAGEVLFFANDKGGYEPRISMHATRSFQDLDPGSRTRLDEIYIDFFYRRHESFWAQQALVKLPAITAATDMLVCGEDLGMVPDSVPPVMKRLGLLSLEIQRMPKSPEREFGHPADAPYLSVVSTGSHDMSTLRGWWEEDTAQTQRFFNDILGQAGGSPFYCEPWIVREVINQHLFSPAMWAIFPLQDLLGMDADLRNEDTQSEQINVPANPKHYWRYRFHLTLEELLKASKFNADLTQMMDDSGRNLVY